MAYLEYQDQKSAKFWQVTVVGKKLVTQWGKLGVAGQVKEKLFGSADAAEAAAEKLVNQKLNKGYVRKAKGKSKKAATKGVAAKKAVKKVIRSKGNKKNNQSADVVSFGKRRLEFSDALEELQGLIDAILNRRRRKEDLELQDEAYRYIESFLTGNAADKTDPGILDFLYQALKNTRIRVGEDILRLVVDNENISEELLVELCSSKRILIQERLIRNPRIPIEVLESFMDSENKHVRFAAKIRVERIKQRDKGKVEKKAVVKKVAKKKPLKNRVISKLEKDEVLGIMQNPNITTEFITEVLAKVPGELPWVFLLGVASSSSASGSQLKEVYRRTKNGGVLEELAKNPMTPPETLTGIYARMEKDDGYLLGTLLTNPNTPQEILAPFLTKRSKERTEIFRNVTKGEFAMTRDGLWNDLARNSGLSEEDQLSLIGFIPAPEDLMENKSLCKAAFDALWEMGIWKPKPDKGGMFDDNYINLKLCSDDQLQQLFKTKHPTAYRSEKAPLKLIKAGRSSRNWLTCKVSWANEGLAVDWNNLPTKLRSGVAEGLACRSDIPKRFMVRLARLILPTGDADKDEYLVYDEVKCSLAANAHVSARCLTELHRQGVNILENPGAPKNILTNVIRDAGLPSYVRRDACKNPQLELKDLSDFIKEKVDVQPVSKNASEVKKHPFYLLQERLREEGWYVEWAAASQGGHFWEDMPFSHQVGPFAGMEIDADKCLFSLEPEIPFPEDMEYEDQEIWIEEYEEAKEKGDSSSIKRLCTSVGAPQNFGSPESVKNETFFCSPTETGGENLEAAAQIFKECGCKYEFYPPDVVRVRWM